MREQDLAPWMPFKSSPPPPKSFPQTLPGLEASVPSSMPPLRKHSQLNTLILTGLIGISILTIAWLAFTMQAQPQVVSHPTLKRADGSIQIGQLRVSTSVLGHGSSTHGTTVFEGSLSGRAVAVKRMLMQFHQVARKEFDALIASDEHPNVLRCYAWEAHDPWVYLALERCDMTLYDAFTQPDPHGRFPQVGDPPTEVTLSIAQGCIRGVEVRLHCKCTFC
jgi:hypothetical protein